MAVYHISPKTFSIYPSNLTKIVVLMLFCQNVHIFPEICTRTRFASSRLFSCLACCLVVLGVSKQKLSRASSATYLLLLLLEYRWWGPNRNQASHWKEGSNWSIPGFGVKWSFWVLSNLQFYTFLGFNRIWSCLGLWYNKMINLSIRISQ